MGKIGRCIVKDREQSPVGESFRVLKSSILDMQEEGDYKILLFTGIGRGEGAALVAANTAAVLAHAGKQVVLVDADIRWPILQSVFGFGLQAGGFTDVISGKKNLEDVVRPSGIENLMVLTNGTKYRGNPVGLLSNEMTRKIFKQLREKADYVIINSSPLRFLDDSIVSDACILATKVDGVVVVIDAQSVRTQVAKKAIELLKGAKAKIIGAVLGEVQDDKNFLYYVEGVEAEAGLPLNGY